MPLPCVAIVGRPNVGKSSLFNRLTGTRHALVHDSSGVTRDRLFGISEHGGRRFRVVDTGGLVPGHETPMETHIRDQVDLALSEADCVLFVVDVQAGLTPMDQEIAEALRTRDIPVRVVANKVDHPKHELAVGEFHEFGFEEVRWVSALHARNLESILDELLELLPEGEDEAPEDRPLRVAFVGKPNVGKSSLVNHLVEHDRVIVSDVAGTTREAIEVPFQLPDGSRSLTLVDTAGLRRKSKVKRGVEKLMRVTTERAIRMADIVVLMIDASEPLSHQDKHIAGLVEKARKPGILALNKIDTFETLHEDLMRWHEDIDYDLSWYDYAPRVALSAHDGRGVQDLLDTLVQLRDRFDYRIPTPRLNKLVREAITVHPPPTQRGKALKIFYAVQRPEWPASFVFKVNDPELVHFSYHRYLENLLREFGEFEGFPVVIRFQPRGEGRRKNRAKGDDMPTDNTLSAEGLQELPPEWQDREIVRTPRRRKKKAKRVVRTPSAPLGSEPKGSPEKKKKSSKPKDSSSRTGRPVRGKGADKAPKKSSKPTRAKRSPIRNKMKKKARTGEKA